MRHIHLIDTSNATDNVGDEIIVDSALKILGPCLADAYVTRSSGHDGLGAAGRKLVSAADLPALRGKVVLFGVGANRDFQNVTAAQRQFLSHVLSPDHLHAVRDSGGARIVQAAGRDVVNTSCHTLWANLPLLTVPETIARRVVFTLTKHKPDPADAAMLAILLDLYPEVWFWPQQPRDLAYLADMPQSDRVQILPPNLAAYDAFLASAPVDVVGTRLHGTIRGLQHGRRSLVIEIDNRARDIGAETGLPSMPRADVAATLAARLRGAIRPKLRLPEADIARFLAQFRPAPVGANPAISAPEPPPVKAMLTQSAHPERSDKEVTHG